MPPAFSSPRQAAAVALLLLLTLLSPVLIGKSLLPSREQMYSAQGWFMGWIDFPYLHQQIFEEKGDIDIAFMGASRMGAGIDASYVQEKLSEKLGRPAVVRSLTWTWDGYDALYLSVSDLLQHRKVRMIICSDLIPANPSYMGIANPIANCWFRYADNADMMDGLPMRAQVSLYASAILGMPRNIVGMLRPNLGATDYTIFDHYLSTFDYTQPAPQGAPEVCIYSEATKANFKFDGTPIPAMQLALIRKIGDLAREHQTQMVCLHLPASAEWGSSVIEERAYWPEAFQGNVAMFGVVPSNLFAGMTAEQAHKLFYDEPHKSNSTHLNQYGLKYFTTYLTPGVVQLYEEQTKP